MRILVIGGSGVIGLKLVEFFMQNKMDVSFSYFSHPVLFLHGVKLDIRNYQDTVNLIQQIKPDIVIHATALTNVDLCETDHNLADSINVRGTENLIKACKLVNCKIIYISTSFVFDGTKSEYYEGDKTSPSTYYGITKEIAEQIISDSGLPYLILRTDQPYCWIEKWQHTNSVIRVINTLKSGKTHHEIIDWYNNPTYVPNFVNIVKNLIVKNHTGIFHLVGNDYINRYDWSLLIAKQFNLDEKLINPIKSHELKLAAKRSNIHLNNDKISKTLDAKMIGVKEGLSLMKKTYRK